MQHASRFRIFLVGIWVLMLPLLLFTLYAGSRASAPKPVTLSEQSVSSESGTLVADEVTPAPLPKVPTGQKADNGAIAAFFGPEFAGKALCKFSKQNVLISGSTLTVVYPQGSSAPSAGAPYGGAQLCVPSAAGTSSEATLNYDLRFPVGFQFIKGGKLPGLYGGKPPFSGGKHNPDGWSMRLMWRENGTAEIYGYISTSTGYGDDWTGGGLKFQADGQWHHISEHVRLNTPGQSDGYATLSYDGTEYIHKDGIAVTTTNTPITGLYFSTFYGGHDSTWSPTADMHIDFANFRRG